jgi:hypothetical protein
MMELVYTLPFLLRAEPDFFKEDMQMAHRCFSTLQDKNTMLIGYNQGLLENRKLQELLDYYNLSAEVLGEGSNVGIAKARQKCFEHVWEHYPDIPFIAEIHLDMVFPPQWYVPLIITESFGELSFAGHCNLRRRTSSSLHGKALVTVPQVTEIYSSF